MFPGGHPSKCRRRPILLDFADRTSVGLFGGIRPLTIDAVRDSSRRTSRNANCDKRVVTVAHLSVHLSRLALIGQNSSEFVSSESRHRQSELVLRVEIVTFHRLRLHHDCTRLVRAHPAGPRPELNPRPRRARPPRGQMGKRPYHNKTQYLGQSKRHHAGATQIVA
ncbi:hypothetical protein EVAR_78930_1 [Eumeta japonica]|uniref:Uncharacterized protein n=1 Tax=Eumeta variegata TaxID=151549 RepID=A0A4C1U2K8_EUMVA|nr:hypothetical protein EVAR_78930_1 [Eumeta japonica]